MKKFLFATLLAIAAVPAFAGVGVSVNVGQPGFYGQIDVGDAPPPQVIYTQPVLVQRAVIPAAPIYLRVPPGHARHWSRHCAYYNACGRPVYFVRDGWYSREYVPYYQAHHGGGPRGGREFHDRDYHDHDHDHGHGRDHDWDHDHRRD